MYEENVIYVGRKPVMTYVLAVMNSLKQKGLDEIVLKARGRAISTAVDAAEVTRRYVKDLEAAVSIGTEQLPTEEGGTRNVSTMEIALTRSPTGEVGKEESEVPAVTPEPVTVEEPAPEEAPAPPPEEEKPSEPKSENEAPEEEKR